jgi:hypothetical protein
MIIADAAMPLFSFFSLSLFFAITLPLFHFASAAAAIAFAIISLLIIIISLLRYAIADTLPLFSAMMLFAAPFDIMMPLR